MSFSRINLTDWPDFIVNLGLDTRMECWNSELKSLFLDSYPFGSQQDIPPFLFETVEAMNCLIPGVEWGHLDGEGWTTWERTPELDEAMINVVMQRLIELIAWMEHRNIAAEPIKRVRSLINTCFPDEDFSLSPERHNTFIMLAREASNMAAPFAASDAKGWLGDTLGRAVIHQPVEVRKSIDETTGEGDSPRPEHAAAYPHGLRMIELEKETKLSSSKLLRLANKTEGVTPSNKRKKGYKFSHLEVAHISRTRENEGFGLDEKKLWSDLLRRIGMPDYGNALKKFPS